MQKNYNSIHCCNSDKTTFFHPGTFSITKKIHNQLNCFEVDTKSNVSSDVQVAT